MTGPSPSASARASKSKPSSSPPQLSLPPLPLPSPVSTVGSSAVSSSVTEDAPIQGSYPARLSSSSAPPSASVQPGTQDPAILSISPDSPFQSPSPKSASLRTLNAPTLSLSPTATYQRKIRKTPWAPLLFGSIQESLEEEEGDRVIPPLTDIAAPSIPIPPSAPVLADDPTGATAPAQPSLIAHLPDLDSLGALGQEVEGSDDGESEHERHDDPAEERSRRRRAREKRKRQEKKRKEQQRAERVSHTKGMDDL